MLCWVPTGLGEVVKNTWDFICVPARKSLPPHSYCSFYSQLPGTWGAMRWLSMSPSAKQQGRNPQHLLQTAPVMQSSCMATSAVLYNCFLSQWCCGIQGELVGGFAHLNSSDCRSWWSLFLWSHLPMGRIQFEVLQVLTISHVLLSQVTSASCFTNTTMAPTAPLGKGMSRATRGEWPEFLWSS